MICALQNGTSRSAKMRQQNRRGGKTPPPCQGELVFAIGRRSRKMVSSESPSAQTKGAQRQSRRMDRTLSDKLDSVRGGGGAMEMSGTNPRPRRRSDVIAPQCPALISPRLLCRTGNASWHRLGMARKSASGKPQRGERSCRRGSGSSNRHATRLGCEPTEPYGSGHQLPGGRYSKDARAPPPSILVCLRSEGACRDRWFVLPDGADPTARPFTGWRAEARLHA
jgi:hypothetical protein